MNSINEQRQTIMIARPLKKKSLRESSDPNIFASLRSTQPLPSLKKFRGKSYDFVGSQQFKEKYLQPQPKYREKVQQVNMQQTNMSPTMNNTMNSTINRNTILSKLTRQQTNLITKQVRQLHRYKQYQDYWQKESRKLHQKTLRKKDAKTLLQDNVKDLYVHNNQDRMDIINNYVVNMWEMSLRNNNKILQRHIKGNTFKPVELQQMLQTNKGIKTVERSIPVLPLDKLKQTKKRDLSLTGRNKAFSETNRTGGASTSRVSMGQTQNQEQVYKISYTGNVKWMSTEGL